MDEQLARFKDVKFVKVKGHSSDVYNILVDKLAVEMTKINVKIEKTEKTRYLFR